MNAEPPTTRLAALVMGWRVVGGRFLMGKRQWRPSWRFKPVTRVADAVRLLEKAAPESCAMNCDKSGTFHVQIYLAGKVGEAHNKSKARAITYAIARALGLEVDNEP